MQANLIKSQSRKSFLLIILEHVVDVSQKNIIIVPKKFNNRFAPSNISADILGNTRSLMKKESSFRDLGRRKSHFFETVTKGPCNEILCREKGFSSPTIYFVIVSLR